jgi:hypothetical protein
MNSHEVLIEGTLRSDGTLELHTKPNLPPGRVTVVLRQGVELELPQNDLFWQRMQVMWDGQKGLANVSRSSAVEREAEQGEMRHEWEDHQRTIERIQEECRLARQTTPGPPS